MSKKFRISKVGDFARKQPTLWSVIYETSQPSGTYKDSAEVKEWLGACADTRKAWSQTQLQSMVTASAMESLTQALQEALLHNDCDRLVALWLNVMGPVAPANLSIANVSEAYGRTSELHKEMAAFVATATMRMALLRCHGVTDSPEAVLQAAKEDLCSWIATGAFRPWTESNAGLNAETSVRAYQSEMQAHWEHGKRLGFMFKDVAQPARVRLAIAAPLAPALESMVIIESLRKAREVADSKEVACG